MPCSLASAVRVHNFAVNRKRCPSGKKLGQKCAQSWLGVLVRAATAPPSAGTRNSPSCPLKTIVPSLPHAPPPPPKVPTLSTTTRTGPPSAVTRLRVTPVKNPSSRESGDQKGKKASSVPGSDF